MLIDYLFTVNQLAIVFDALTVGNNYIKLADTSILDRREEVFLKQLKLVFLLKLKKYFG